jgi:pectate lyase
MKHLLQPALFVLILVLGLHRAPAATPWTWQEATVPDPGFDLDSAQIVRVTSLADRGAGSLRDALRVKGPRIIVFDIAGVIELEQKNIDIKEGQVVIAGQTAPSPGITIVKGGLNISARQVVVQHLRVRPGDAGMAKKSGWEPDGITTYGDAAQVWIDHCSATWAVDEQISASSSAPLAEGEGHRIVIRNCIIAEGLHNSTHAKGPHSKGTLVLDGTKEVAIVGNLYSSNVERNPLFKLDTSGVVVNNVIANPGQRAVHATIPDAESGPLPKARIAVVGNVVFHSPTSKTTSAVFEGVADGYFKDNEGFFWNGTALPVLRKPFETLAEPPVWPVGLKALSPAAAIWHVTRFAGARPAERDAIDQRIVREALTGMAHILDSQEQVGGYPRLTPVTRATEVPDKDRRGWLQKLALEVEQGVHPEDAGSEKK